VIGGIPLPIAADLGDPVIPIVLRYSASAFARMPVPEATVDKYHLMTVREHDVRLAGKVFSVKSEPIATTVKKRSDLKLWLCVAALNRSHRRRALRINPHIRLP